MADTKQNTAKGKLLATGKGIAEMLRSCQKHHFTNDNTILEVDEPRAYNSAWRIYELKQVKEEYEK